jgi:predicted metal-dependent HD superfamily phosphohydrolase
MSPEEINQLKHSWNQLFQRYCVDEKLRDSQFELIYKKYSDSSRHYHNINHISSMLALAEQHSSLIRDKDIVLFSIWFHDIVYNPLKKDNEEKSRDLADEMMSRLNIEAEKIKRVHEYILATKTHSGSEDSDLSFFLDLDLSILGASAETYDNYCRNVRKEYSWVPDMLYKPGRIKVLRHFLDMEKIFKTELFYNLFETKARENLENEMSAIEK